MTDIANCWKAIITKGNSPYSFSYASASWEFKNL